MYKPIVLVVLDGWGVAPKSDGNAISQANKPNMDNYQKNYPNCLIQSSGISVGLAWGEKGNSEVGHLSIGSGRVLYQNLPRISLSIQDGSFFNNPKFKKAIEHVKSNNSTLHIMGLASNGGVHGHIDHLLALLELAAKENVKKVNIHAFTDGRDSGTKDAIGFISKVKGKIEQFGIGQLASVMGRFYSMDRSSNWDRTQKAYQCLTKGEGEKTDNIEAAITEYYQKDLTDEHIPPTLINNKQDNLISDNDAVVFFNFREDRARQLTKAFVLPGFMKFKRPETLKNLFFVAMTQYEKNLPVEIAFEPLDINETLGFILSEVGYRQLRIAETEKYAHVTYFFNGGIEVPFEGEDRILIPSSPMSSYAKYPEMRAQEITDRAIEEINKNIYDFVLINYANADMVGHTGDFEATEKSIEFVDLMLGNLVDNVLSIGGITLITGDHGNADEMISLENGMNTTEHSSSPVPLYLIASNLKRNISTQDTLKSENIPLGILADIAPTILELMGLPKPKVMTGMSLLGSLVKD